MRATAAIVVLLSLTVAGCIGGPAAESGDQDWPTITDPKNLSYDTDSGMHVHDYWGGKDTVEVVDQTKEGGRVSQGPDPADTLWTGRYLPENGSVVPQGTASMTIRVSWTDDFALNEYGDVQLWVKPANASEPRLVEDALDNGAAVEIPVAYEEADLPHQVVSAWEWQVRIRGGDNPAYGFYAGEVTLQAQAHRGLELRPFPPHPDHWGNRTEIELVDGSASFRQVSVDGRQRTYCYGCPNPEFRPPNGTLVPLGTERVEVTLEWEPDVPGGDLELFYRGAHTRQWQRLEPEAEDPGSKHYVIPVDETMADTPYANASLWEFKVTTPTDPREPLYFAGDIQLQATAYKG